MFHARLLANRFTGGQKRTLGAALPQVLKDAADVPAENQVATINTHGADELFLDPCYTGV